MVDKKKWLNHSDWVFEKRLEKTDKEGLIDLIKKQRKKYDAVAGMFFGVIIVIAFLIMMIFIIAELTKTNIATDKLLLEKAVSMMGENICKSKFNEGYLYGKFVEKKDSLQIFCDNGSIAVLNGGGP